MSTHQSSCCKECWIIKKQFLSNSNKTYHISIFAFEKIRLNKVFEAARWPINNGSFRNDEVEVDGAWLYDFEEMQYVEENSQT